MAVLTRFCSPIPLQRTIKNGPGEGWGGDAEQEETGSSLEMVSLFVF